MKSFVSLLFILVLCSSSAVASAQSGPAAQPQGRQVSHSTRTITIEQWGFSRDQVPAEVKKLLEDQFPGRDFGLPKRIYLLSITIIGALGFLYHLRRLRTNPHHNLTFPLATTTLLGLIVGGFSGYAMAEYEYHSQEALLTLFRDSTDPGLANGKVDEISVLGGCLRYRFSGWAGEIWYRHFGDDLYAPCDGGLGYWNYICLQTFVYAGGALIVLACLLAMYHLVWVRLRIRQAALG
ncbi:MAG: hypothetical protein IPJ27_23255 [Candidatus Accumulibacter sp.]|uniref:Uncharacterized protein n=1 Tax=Candidatus Accumulibacter proximus TaxID=2954385 RepID=A0A935Q3W3_9PROT|nr:hypothetical protein [Candidatus Accumulibacter proximus]